MNKWLDRRVAKPGPYLTLCLTEEEQNRETMKLLRREINFPETGATCHIFAKATSGELCTIVSVSLHSQKHAEAIEMAGLLVHEAVHVWQAYAQDMGEAHPGAEQEAYAIQGIAQELLAEYARRIA